MTAPLRTADAHALAVRTVQQVQRARPPRGVPRRRGSRGGRRRGLRRVDRAAPRFMLDSGRMMRHATTGPGVRELKESLCAQAAVTISTNCSASASRSIQSVAHARRRRCASTSPASSRTARRSRPAGRRREGLRPCARGGAQASGSTCSRQDRAAVAGHESTALLEAVWAGASPPARSPEVRSIGRCASEPPGGRARLCLAGGFGAIVSDAACLWTRAVTAVTKVTMGRGTARSPRLRRNRRNTCRNAGGGVDRLAGRRNGVMRDRHQRPRAR